VGALGLVMRLDKQWRQIEPPPPPPPPPCSVWRVKVDLWPCEQHKRCCVRWFGVGAADCISSSSSSMRSRSS
jgi:hypothetical protein